MKINPKLNVFRRILKENFLDGLTVSSVVNIQYLTGYSNFSKDERESLLLITNDQQFLFTDGRYTEAVKKHVPNFLIVERSASETLIDSVSKIIKKFGLKKIGFEGHNLSHLEHLKLSKKVLKLVNVNLIDIRSIKDKTEINLIQNACNLTDKAFKFILSKIRVGISEKELAFEIEFFIKKNGGDLAFQSIVAFDKHSSIPHHQTGDAVLKDESGQFILLDFGASVDGYCSDMTRTIFFGKPTSKQVKIYETVLSAQQNTAEYIQKQLSSGKNIKASDADKIARNYIKSRGFSDIPHGLGHGVGLQVHESPRLSIASKDILEESMIFSIEPGIYIPDFGGVRIEDLFMIEGKKLRQLTKSPSTLTVL